MHKYTNRLAGKKQNVAAPAESRRAVRGNTAVAMSLFPSTTLLCILAGSTTPNCVSSTTFLSSPVADVWLKLATMVSYQVVEIDTSPVAFSPKLYTRTSSGNIPRRAKITRRAEPPETESSLLCTHAHALRQPSSSACLPPPASAETGNAPKVHHSSTATHTTNHNRVIRSTTLRSSTLCTHVSWTDHPSVPQVCRSALPLPSTCSHSRVLV